MIFSSVVRANRNQQFVLPEYLSLRFTYYSRDEWAEKLAQGIVCVDGEPAGADAVVTAGQTISYDAGDFDEPPADCAYTIIYEDEWLFAVNKPGNLLIHRAGRSFKSNLMYQLREVHAPPYPDAHSIHRLDRNTSGVVLIAKSSDIQATISKQFMERNIDKRYIAFIENPLPALPSLVNAPVMADLTSTRGCTFKVDVQGKEAITEVVSWELLGKSALKVYLRPHTGRTHQLRVHMAYTGHPIIGDETYGSRMTFDHIVSGYTNVNKRHPRHALHCEQITFFHPWRNQECTITAPLPEDMKNVEIVLREETAEATEKGA